MRGGHAANARQRRFSAIELLSALGLLFLTFPFVDQVKAGDLIESILLTIVLLSAVLAIRGRGTALWIALLLAAPTLIARWANHFWPDQFSADIFLGWGIVLLVYVIWHLLAFVLRAPVVDTEVLCASISAYLLLGLAWTCAYWMVGELNPGAFAFNVASAGTPTIKGFNGFYFSFITLCTVGYGDITPVSNGAKMLAAMEAVTGLLYVAVLIARLVSIHAASRAP